MNTKTFTSLLEHPESLQKEQHMAIENIIAAFPYFQAPKAIHLKGLKNQESFRYNTELKITAAYTTDRHVLFDFITSSAFRNHKKNVETTSKTIVKKIEDIAVQDSQVLIPLPSVPMDDALQMKLPEANDVLDPKLFSIKQPLKKTNQITEHIPSEPDPKEILQPDKPFEFDQNEMHSFSEWLKLTALQPIQRDENVIPIVGKTAREIPEVQKNQSKKTLHKEKKFKIIDEFISNNPKIGPVTKETSSRNFAKENIASPDTLMTETLAKVYVAQKNYKKAIQAYNILILKNPEKSGFFADQIRAIKKLQDNK